MPDPLIPDYDKRSQVVQPNFQRTRVPYRSPLSSVSVNLESEQIRFDLYNLAAQLEQLRIELDTILEDFYLEGATPSTPYPANLISSSIKDLIAKVAGYETRLRALETKRGFR